MRLDKFTNKNMSDEKFKCLIEAFFLNLPGS